MANKVLLWVGVILLVVVFIGTGSYVLIQQSVSESTKIEIKYLRPVVADLKCDVIRDNPVSYVIPKEGLWISKKSINAVALTVDNIKVSVPKTIWESLQYNYLLGGMQIRYELCDANEQNCQEKPPQKLKLGQNTLAGIPSAIDITRESIYVIVEGKTTLISSWKPLSNNNMALYYQYKNYGLKLYSTSISLSGKVICSDSCDLSCPTQEQEARIIQTDALSLNPTESTQYIESWSDINFLGAKEGGVYSESKEQFCFGGFIYNQGKYEIETGLVYIYPETYVKKELCCPGTKIQTNTGYKLCNNDYQWKIITADENIKCKSDFDCPGLGLLGDLQENSKYYQVKNKCENNICKETVRKEVACIAPNIGCPADQVCSNDGKCTLGSLSGGLIDSGKDPQQTKCEQDGGQWIVTKETVPTFWSTIGFGDPKIVEKPECYKVPYLTYIIFGIIALIAILLITQPRTQSRRRK